MNTAGFAADGTTTQSATAQTTITQQPAYTLLKTSDVGGLSGPGLVSYEIVLSNVGNVGILGVSLTDAAAQGGVSVALASGRVLRAGSDDGNGILDVGEVWTYDATIAATQAHVDDGAALINTASFDTSEVGPKSDAATTSFTQTPAFTIAKTVDLATLSAPGTLTYTVTVANTGNTSLTNVALTDTLDQNGTGATPSSGPTINSNGNGDTVLDVGETWVWTAGFAATQAHVDDGNPLINTASITSDQTPTAVTATATTNFTQTADITFEKAVKSTSATTYTSVGDVVTYEYTITNSGNTTLQVPLTVSDDQIAGTLTCSATALAPGASVSCDQDWIATQAFIDARFVTNIATATDGVTTSNTDSVTVNAVQTPKLGLVKSYTGGSFGVGNTLSYDYVVTNTGNTTVMSEITITDNKIAPANLSCPTILPAGLAPTASIICTGTYVVTAGDVALGSVLNVATASAGTIVSAPNQEQYPTSAPNALTLTKAAQPAGQTFSSVGDILTYEYTITNSGGAPYIVDLEIVDDKIGTFTCHSPTSTASFDSGDTVSCLAQYAVTQADLDAGEVTNVAVAQTIYAPSNPTLRTEVFSNSDSVTLSAVKNPSLVLSKDVTAGNDPAAVGDSLTYTITATNNGNQTLTDVAITDQMLGALSCDLTAPVTLSPADVLTCTGQYIVQQSDIDAQTLTNTADGTANDPDGGGLTPQVTDVHPLVASAPEMVVAKTVTPDPGVDPAYRDPNDPVVFKLPSKTPATQRLQR